MPNLIKKSWTLSNPSLYSLRKCRLKNGQIIVCIVSLAIIFALKLRNMGLKYVLFLSIFSKDCFSYNHTRFKNG